jgi:threonine aldolase
LLLLLLFEGVVAAAGLHAINNEEGHIQRLSLDHALASQLGKRLKKAGYQIAHNVDTNIIYFGPPVGIKLNATEFSTFMKSEFNVHVGGGYSGGRLMRAVVHRDLSEKEVEIAACAFEDVLLKLS